MKPTSFKFDEKTTYLLDDLKSRSHSASRAEVIRKSLYLLDFVTKAKNNGGRVMVKGSDGVDCEIIVL